MIGKPAHHNVAYDIPRHSVGHPGRQDRIVEGTLRVTPGMTEPMEFTWGTGDGVPINLSVFTAKLIFWTRESFASEAPDLLEHKTEGEVILSKDMEIPDPYEGIGSVILTSSDTDLIGRRDKDTPVYWGVYLVNGDKEMFPATVTRSGARSSRVLVDRMNGSPNVDTIKNL